jgi:hypothetical protein
MSGGLPPGIKWLLIVNVAIFLLGYLPRGSMVNEILGRRFRSPHWPEP